MLSNNWLLSIKKAWNQGSIIISNYDITLLQFLFCKNTVNLKKCLAAFPLLFCCSSNGWLQLELRINSIPLEKGMTISVCFKENNTLENTKLIIAKVTANTQSSLQKDPWNNDGTTQIYGCKCSFEIKIRFKSKYLTHKLYLSNS